MARKRGNFTESDKAEAVKLYQESGQSIAQVAQGLGLCRALGVSRQGYCAWLARPPSAREKEDAGLAEKIRELHKGRHKGRAGIGRITWDLAEDGTRTSGRRVRRLARAQGLKCVHPGPSARTTIRDSAARTGLAGLVNRDFTASAPGQLRALPRDRLPARCQDLARYPLLREGERNRAVHRQPALDRARLDRLIRGWPR